jgi:hypothetical protein
MSCLKYEQWNKTSGGGFGMNSVLGRRTLNRALLERQLLLQRAKLPVLNVIEHLVGLQAQSPTPPYYGLWSRLDSFRQEDLSQLLIDRKVVRIALMRSTIHLVSADDCLALRPVVQSVQDRSLKGSHGKYLAGLNMAELATISRILVEEQPRTFSELGKLLTVQWPDRQPAALGAAVRTLLPLVQVPPRGIWGSSGQAIHTTADSWLGRALTSNTLPDDMILRYLAAFGPASIKDMQVWSGLTRLNEAIQRLKPRLCTYCDENGVELFDLLGHSLPKIDTPAPPRFLAEYDNMLLSYADRTRIIADPYRSQIFTANGIIRAAVLIDGFVNGTWRIEHHRGSATLIIEPFKSLSIEDRTALTEEGSRLLSFAAADALTHDIQFKVHS